MPTVDLGPCECCGGAYRCVSASCNDSPSQLVFTLSAVAESGQPWVDTSQTVIDPNGVFGEMTKRGTITFPQMSETIVVNLQDLGTPTGSFPAIQGNFLSVYLPNQSSVEAGYCTITARARQDAFTLQAEDGSDAYTGYAYERREVLATVELSGYASRVTVVKQWTGMGLGYGLGGSNRPLERITTTFFSPSTPAPCKTFDTNYQQTTSGTSRGGFYEDLIGNNGQFCLIPGYDGSTAAPNVGEEYGYMVGYISGCVRKWFGYQLRVASSNVNLDVSFQ